MEVSWLYDVQRIRRLITYLPIHAKVTKSSKNAGQCPDYSMIILYLRTSHNLQPAIMHSCASRCQLPTSRSCTQQGSLEHLGSLVSILFLVFIGWMKQMQDAAEKNDERQIGSNIIIF